MPDSLEEIVERLVKATGPDREIDVEIGECIGAADHSGPAHHRPFRDWARRYTASLDAAMTLVPVGMPFVIGADSVGASAGVNGGCCEAAKTPALALCIAALRARISTSTGD